VNCGVNYRPLHCCRNTRADCGGPRGCRCVAATLGRVRGGSSSVATTERPVHSVFRRSSQKFRRPRSRRDRPSLSPTPLPRNQEIPFPRLLAATCRHTPAKISPTSWTTFAGTGKRSDRDFPAITYTNRVADATQPRTRRNYKEVKLK